MSKTSHGPVSMELDYEERSVPLRLLVGWIVGLFLGLGAVLALVFFLYGTPHMRPQPELVLTRLMNQPALQSDATGDLKAFQAKQEEELTTYGWVNQSQGVVRLPIEKAIEMVLQKGLPARGGKQ